MEREMVKSMLRYLMQKSSDGSFDADESASLEVACECIQSVFQINPAEMVLEEKVGLLEVFEVGGKALNYAEIEITDEDRKLGESYKETGNNHMKNGLFIEAVDCYSQAIKVDPSVATYYSNRSAAYYKLGQFENALTDGKKAVDLSPDYAQAYGRVGSACLALKRYTDAVQAFELAVRFDDTKPAFKENLELARKELESSNTMPNIGELFKNPEVMRMASQLMTDGNVMSAMNNMMAGEQSPNMESLMQMGQQFAQQLRDTNPEMIEQIQNVFRQPPGNNNNN